MRSKWVSVGLAALLGLVAGEGQVLASVPTVPEISPGSISAGMALLAGGVLLLRARRSK